MFNTFLLVNSLLLLEYLILSSSYGLVCCIEFAGLKRKLTNNLSPPNPGLGPEWEVGECVGVYWRPNFETILYPYVPPHITRPKECKKLFVSPLPEKCYFAVSISYPFCFSVSVLYVDCVAYTTLDHCGF